MTPNEFNTLFDAFGIFGLLMACIPLLITIGLIVAIFQINGRIATLIQLQQRANTHAQQTEEIQRQAFIAQLASQGPNHQAYLDYLVDTEQLTQDQADFVLKQSGNIEELPA